MTDSTRKYRFHFALRQRGKKRTKMTSNLHIKVTHLNINTDRCQDSAIINFWHEWKWCVGQKAYSVFNGLYCCLTSCQLFSWWNGFPKNGSGQVFHKTVLKVVSCENDVIYSRTFIQCAIVKTLYDDPSQNRFHPC